MSNYVLSTIVADFMVRLPSMVKKLKNRIWSIHGLGTETGTPVYRPRAYPSNGTEGSNPRSKVSREMAVARACSRFVVVTNGSVGHVAS